MPSNDAFFYDGPVVNFLLHGKYANPSLALALPISGGEVFCAYPPLYQLGLLGWMGVFGVSAVSAMSFHLVLFGICLLLLLAIFRRLELPAWTVHIAAMFLLVITFQDRPDSLAHVFGLAGVYAWIRSRHRVMPRRGWTWAMATFVILSLATGLQIGGVYFLLVWIGTLAATFFAKDELPVASLAALVLVPMALVALVALGFPHLWAGFLEHARQTPSLTGWRIPRLAEILKMIRTLPGILAVAVLLPWWFPRRVEFREAGKEMLWLLALACTLAAMAIIVASMFVLTPNSVFFASYLQPVIVASYLAMMPTLTLARAGSTSPRPAEDRRALPGLARLQAFCFIALAAIGAIRTIGMSTWGLACAADLGYPTAIESVRAELNSSPSNSLVVLSSAYLYEAARHNNVRWVHSDWMTPAERGGSNRDLEALISLRPSKLILTQFDFYRRYEPILTQLKLRPEVSEFRLANLARTPPPDSFKSLQKVVQHVSWAPVIVSLSWK